MCKWPWLFGRAFALRRATRGTLARGVRVGAVALARRALAAGRARTTERIGLEFGAGLDVDVPPAQAAGETHVLTLLADRERLLVLVDDHHRRTRVDVGEDVVEVDRRRL